MNQIARCESLINRYVPRHRKQQVPRGASTVLGLPCHACLAELGACRAGLLTSREASSNNGKEDWQKMEKSVKLIGHIDSARRRLAVPADTNPRRANETGLPWAAVSVRSRAASRQGELLTRYRPVHKRRDGFR